MVEGPAGRGSADGCRSLGGCPGPSRARACCAGLSRLCRACRVRFRHLWDLRSRVEGRLRGRGVDHHTAGILASETMTVAWQRLDDVPVAAAEAEAWLHAVARRLLSNHRRTVGRARRREEVYASSVRVTCEQPDDLPLLALREAWEALSPVDREVLRLEASEGLDPGGLAEKMDCGPGAATTRLSRARSRLRSLMDR